MNLANKLTISRVVMIPLLVAIYLMEFIPYNHFLAGLIFTIAILTDFIDGKVARNRNQVTNLGKVLDPVADKLIVFSAIFLFIIDGTLNIYLGLGIVFILITRDYLVTGLRQISASEGQVIPAGNLGKAKTMIQSISIIIFFIYAGLNSINASGQLPVELFAYLTLAIAVFLTIWSGVIYMYNGKKLLKK